MEQSKRGSAVTERIADIVHDAHTSYNNKQAVTYMEMQCRCMQ